MRSIIDILKTKPSDFFKNQSIRKNIINSFYYFGGTIVQFLVAIITQPLYSRHLELEDFATISYFGAIQAVLYPLFSMSLPFYYLSRYWKPGNEEEGKSNLSFILNFLNISNAVIALISFMVISIYFKVFNIMFPLMPFLIIVMANLFFEKYKTYYLLECRVEKKGLNYFLINIVQIILNTVFSIYFVVFLKGGASGRMSGILVGVIITGLVTLFLLIKEKKYFFSFKMDIAKLRQAIKYSIPIIIGAYAYYPIDNIDRIFLERLHNTSQYGYYSIGLTISGFAGTFFLSVYQSFEPDLYKFISQKKYKQYILFVLFYIMILGILSLLFILFSKYIISFMTSGRYVDASDYANLFIIAIFFMQIGGIFEQLYTAFGATKLLMLKNIIMGIFCLITYYILISKFQFIGAGMARIVTGVFYVILSASIIYFYLQKYDIKKSAEQNQ